MTYDLRRSPLLLVCIGFLSGLAVAEAAYYLLTPVVLADGAVSVLTDRDYYAEVSSLLANSRESIHMLMFSANPQDPEAKADSGGKVSDAHVDRLMQQLAAAKNRGVDVRVAMDAWPEGNDRAEKYLKDNNIPVRLIKSDGTMHSKLIVIDGRIVVVGSTNWSYHSIDKNNEANVVISDARIAALFGDYFSRVAG